MCKELQTSPQVSSETERDKPGEQEASTIFCRPQFPMFFTNYDSELRHWVYTIQQVHIIFSVMSLTIDTPALPDLQRNIIP